MLDLFEIIAIPLGWIIRLIYDLVKNYGLAIILFTVVIKLVIFPLTFKSQKAMKKQQKIQPIILQLQQKYANDKEKLQREMMKVYKENNVSMAGGCLPLLIQMPILFGLYRVIQSPLTHILGVDVKAPETISRVQEIIQRMSVEWPNTFSRYASYLPDKLEDLQKLLLKNEQIRLSTWSTNLYGAADAWSINFDFLGLNLAEVPSQSIRYLGQIFEGNFQNLSIVLLLLIPAIAIFTTWLSMKQSQKMTGQNQTAQADGENPAASMSKSMNLMMPIMTGIFAFTLPAGLGVYWIISNVFQMAQQYFLNSYFDKKGEDFVVKVPETNRKNSKKRK